MNRTANLTANRDNLLGCVWRDFSARSARIADSRMAGSRWVHRVGPLASLVTLLVSCAKPAAPPPEVVSTARVSEGAAPAAEGASANVGAAATPGATPAASPAAPRA